jgi:thiopeptide-type bacteriocin biosynthesis protein
MNTTRFFMPGSEWLYLKVYTGIKSADTLLTIFYQVLRKLKKEQLLRQFFFIRYQDPHFHLRFRLHLTNKRGTGAVLAILEDKLKPLVENGIVWNVQLDTYKRELERYGVDTIDIVESLFCIDSECLIQLICRSASDNNENLRWSLALPLVDDMLECAELNTASKEKLLQQSSLGFKQEFGFTAHAQKKQLSEKYRQYKGRIFEVLDNQGNGILQDYVSILRKRKTHMEPLVKGLDRINKESAIPVMYDSLLQSLMHMTMNRLFRSNNRLHEMVIYDLLHQYYKSKIARLKYDQAAVL